MQVEHIRKMADQALERLAEQLEQGKSDQLKEFLAAMGRFWHYSLGNQWLIAAQRPDATRVAGFHTWRKLGRTVKKGQRGIAIMAPIVFRKRKRDDAEAPTDEEEEVCRFRVAYVFDISQTEGKPLPDTACVEGDPAEYLERLMGLIEAKGIKLEYRYLGTALGASAGGTIYLREGLAPAERFATLVHEVAHELLHQGDKERPSSKTVREVEAESVAFTVCESIGLTTSTASSDYIQLYDGNKDTLRESLARIRDTATEILAGVTAEANGDQRGTASQKFAAAA
jgi:antirestriction protein ArdC